MTHNPNTNLNMSNVHALPSHRRTCQVPGCTRTHVAKGMCQHHYDKARGGSGKARKRKKIMSTSPVTTIDEAISNVLARFANATNAEVRDLAEAARVLYSMGAVDRVLKDTDVDADADTYKAAPLVSEGPTDPDPLMAPPQWANSLEAWSRMELAEQQRIWAGTLKPWAQKFTRLDELRAAYHSSVAEGRVPFDARITDLIIEWWITWRHECSEPDDSGPHDMAPAQSTAPLEGYTDHPEGDTDHPEDVVDADDIDF